MRKVWMRRRRDRLFLFPGGRHTVPPSLARRGELPPESDPRWVVSDSAVIASEQRKRIATGTLPSMYHTVFTNFQSSGANSSRYRADPTITATTLFLGSSVPPSVGIVLPRTHSIQRKTPSSPHVVTVEVNEESEAQSSLHHRRQDMVSIMKHR